MPERTPVAIRPKPPGGLDFGEGLVDKEGTVLACTLEVVSKVDDVYQLFSTLQLYPHNVSNAAIKSAALKNPDIFDPRKIVRSDGKQLMAVPYSEVLEEPFKPVIFWIDQASRSTQDHGFKNYLHALIEELEAGDEITHEKSMATWLFNEEPEVDLFASPSDRYDDTRFNRKYSPQAWTGAQNYIWTPRLTEFTTRQLEVWQDICPDYAPRTPKIVSRADNTKRLGGLAMRMTYSANSMPSEQYLRERYGSKITYFIPSLNYRLREQRIPMLKKVIPYETRRRWTEEELVEAGILLMATHEPSHSLIRRPQDEERLRKNYTYTNEMYSTVLGLAILGLRTDISEGLKEKMLAVQFATFAHDYEVYLEGNRDREIYLRGFATIFDRLLNSKAIRIDSNGHIRWNIQTRIFHELLMFTGELELLSKNGNQQDAEALKKGRGSLVRFDYLAPFRHVA